MSISAEIVCDSVSADTGKRITSLLLRYPRFIHAEFMTHRMFSRNASSSRAIPVEKMIRMIKEDTAMPVHWGKNQPGMQAHEECNELVFGLDFNSFDRRSDGLLRHMAWFQARDKAIEVAEAFHKAGYHKQIVNRLLEPFMHITVLVTATEWENFFDLRIHPDAQPEIHELANKMWDAMQNSAPHLLKQYEWHLPFIRAEDRELRLLHQIQSSVARCARTSYLTHDGKNPSLAKDLELYNRLVGAQPWHASPTEHQAMPSNFEGSDYANFRGWIQFRGILEANKEREITEFVDRLAPK